MTSLPGNTAAVGIRCSNCQKYLAEVNMPEIKQPKHLAKKFRWKHGRAKGSWICPECQKYMPVQLE